MTRGMHLWSNSPQGFRSNNTHARVCDKSGAAMHFEIKNRMLRPFSDRTLYSRVRSAVEEQTGNHAAQQDAFDRLAKWTGKMSLYHQFLGHFHPQRIDQHDLFGSDCINLQTRIVLE